MEEKKKSNTTKYILLSCGVVLIISFICLAALLLTGIGVSMFWPINFSEGSTQISSPTPVIDRQETPFSENQETPSSDLPDQIANTINEIESQVMSIRGLDTSHSVEHTLISEAELENIVVEDFFSEYTDEDARQDALVLSSLGLLPVDFDLKGFYQSLYSEQIAGFYDDETKEIYVVQGQDFGGNEKLTYAHEFTHVLQDQTYDLNQGLGINEEACEVDSERCAAIQALIEGDATQTELLWFQEYGSLEDYRDLMDMLDILETPILDSAPPYMAADIYFPYENGLAFVQSLYDQDKFESVDAAYLDPPASTEQILHPEKYPDDKPLNVTLPDLSTSLGDQWTLFDQNVMGEWYTYLILNKAYQEDYRLPESLAEDAAEGWGGDAYAVYLNENTDDTIFIMDTVWDSSEDADEFVQAFGKYADMRWESSPDLSSGAAAWEGLDVEVGFWHEEDRTLWVMAPSAELLDLVLLELQ